MTASTARKLPDDFYDRVKADLHARIGKELRLARRVLDLGCGACDLVRYLAETYRQKVTGVDVKSAAFPRRRVSANGVRFRCVRRSAVRMAFVRDDSSDAVVMMWALHEMDRPRAVLAEVRRALRPGGEVLIVDFPRGSLAQKLWDEDYYRPVEVARLLEEAGFADVRVRLIQRRQVLWARAHRPVDGNPPTSKGPLHAMGQSGTV